MFARLERVRGDSSEDAEAADRLVSVRIESRGRAVTLSSHAKWRRAIELGDLEPGSIVELERASGREAPQEARFVLELAELFEAHGFKLDDNTATRDAEEIIDAPTQDREPAPPSEQPNELPAALPAQPSPSSQEAPPVKLDTWSDITAIASPGPAPILPSEKPWNGGDKYLKARGLRQDARRGAVIVASVLFAANWLSSTDKSVVLLVVVGLACYWVWPNGQKEKRKALRADVRAAKAEWESLLTRWKQTASGDAYDKLRAQFLKAHEAIEEMWSRRDKELAALNDRSVQLRAHLSKFPVDHRSIQGVGQARAMILRANGFLTAADISPAVANLQGFGPATYSNLYAWKLACEQSFVHDPRRSEDPREVKKIDGRYSEELTTLSKPMHGAARRLHEVRAQILAARASLEPKLVQAWARYKSLKLQLRAL